MIFLPWPSYSSCATASVLLAGQPKREPQSFCSDGLAEISERIGVDLEKSKLAARLKKQRDEKAKQIEGYTKDRAKLLAKGSELRVARLGTLNAAADKVRAYLRRFASKEQSLLSMQDEVGNLRTSAASEALRKMSERHHAAALKPEEWQPFLLDYKGDVDSALKTHIATVKKVAKDWKGAPPAHSDDANAALIADDADLDRQPLALLEAEIARLEKLVNVDRDTANKYAALSKRIADETAALVRLNEKLTDCQGAKARASELVKERDATYERVFDAIVSEEAVLRDLYSPLLKRLEASAGSMKKLSFSVARDAAVASWAAAGESLLDLRNKGPFRGKGTLRQLAEAALKPAWETGDSKTVSAAMAAFRNENDDALMERAPVPKTEQANYREWSKRFAKWLYKTDHIKIHYSIDYDGVDIRKLSPGSRGIVLLLLYLALDMADDGPLIIDQPDDNLAPKSIFDELVGLFLDVKSKRQVIMVTHNANLVVNTDADQIIVAKAGPHPPGELPPISYLSGGLESAHIRKAVCDILEGGEVAFKERARRLRVRLDR